MKNWQKIKKLLWFVPDIMSSLKIECLTRDCFVSDRLATCKKIWQTLVSDTFVWLTLPCLEFCRHMSCQMSPQMSFKSQSNYRYWTHCATPTVCSSIIWLANVCPFPLHFLSSCQKKNLTYPPPSFEPGTSRIEILNATTAPQNLLVNFGS